jgi:hypothetical protein
MAPPYERTPVSVLLLFRRSMVCPYSLRRNLATLFWFAVRCDHGGPPLGHPHGAAVWHDGGRRDAQSERAGAAGRRVDLSVGYGEGHGAGAGVVRNRFRSGFPLTPLTSFDVFDLFICREVCCTHCKLKQPFFQVLFCSLGAKPDKVSGENVLILVGHMQLGRQW